MNFELEELHEDNQTIEDVIDSFVRPFNLLIQEPLFRAGVLIIDSQNYVFLFDIHHIIADGTSLDILLKDLSSYYHNDVLSDLPIQYKDYSIWLNSLELTKQRNYWEERLKAFPDALDIPTDFYRKQTQNYSGAVAYKEIDSQLSSKIGQFIKDNKVTGMVYKMIL